MLLSAVESTQEHGISRNFDEVGLPRPEHLFLGDMEKFDTLVRERADRDSGACEGSASLADRYAAFDAVVPDPPYGLMEGLGEYYMPLDQRLNSLLRFSARR